MKILIVTDAWHPQINGVVRSLSQVAKHAGAFGKEVSFLTPDGFRAIALPTYPDIRLALPAPGQIAGRIEAVRPDFIHIATEGPLGILARRYCLKRGRAFTTSYHTRFPEYVSARLPVPPHAVDALLCRFHAAACGTMVSTASLEQELLARGYSKLMRWSRGVDAELYHPRKARPLPFAGPVFLSVGRVAVEKNLEAFLSLDLPGAKVVAGDGPALPALRQRFQDAHFLGAVEGEALAALYAAADVFVFPSLTDTFGIVMLEALASGLPVAAFPVAGPLDVIGNAPVGLLDRDLRNAALAALTVSRAACRTHALGFLWRESARQFLDNVLQANGAKGLGPSRVAA